MQLDEGARAQMISVSPEPVEPKASAANDALRREAWFDRLTTNG